jgi:AraC-like DNA-binding protein/quercetin dioxygenase-like cupin family protein
MFGMKITEKSSLNNPISPIQDVVMVDYNNRPDLKINQVSFHWWDNMVTSMHYHNHFEFFIVTEGKTTHFLNGVTSEISKNTLYLICPEDRHQFTPIPGYHSQHINFSVIPQKLESLCLALGIDLLALIANPVHSVILSEDAFSFFLNRSEQLNLAKGGSANSLAVLIITEMISQALTILYKNTVTFPNNYPEWFSHLILMMHSPKFLSSAVKDIYALSNYSPPMIIKYFKQYTGETIVTYFTKVKMNYACNLFRTTNFKTLEIANRLGFDSLSHFNKIFKKYAGKSPSVYRKQSRQNGIDAL